MCMRTQRQVPRAAVNVIMMERAHAHALAIAFKVDAPVSC